MATARVVAARALGKPLPATVEVHHVNGDPRDNRPCNLVICQDTAYHRQLHMRARARGWTPAHCGITYLLRGIDAGLWRKVKTKAAAQGTTTRDVILRLLAEWVKQK